MLLHISRIRDGILKFAEIRVISSVRPLIQIRRPHHLEDLPQLVLLVLPHEQRRPIHLNIGKRLNLTISAIMQPIDHISIEELYD